ncbi:hypothetical protein KTT58_17030 [Pseudomonas viridiflava]|uniref:hypothetical protein n=1 Tax=Pseudomonas viridiflava TaxID=33069 RepID=UPI001C2D58C9|nr:hypothetical protein [Pseudomonas viridiflava]MBV1814450.1 hypothetical protein [Pseudomonas viridiflava]
MRQRTIGLDWLDENDREQRRWALSYLQTKGRANSSVATHKFMLERGLELEKSADGRKILDLMKNAWRQKRGRAPTNGKQPCTFTLQLSTKRTLARLAKANDMPATSLLEILIENAASEAKDQKEWMKQQKTRTNDLKRELEEGKIRQAKTEVHLEKCFTFLTDWEAALKGEGSSDINELTIEAKSLPPMELIKQEINHALEAIQSSAGRRRSSDLKQRSTSDAIPPIRKADLVRFHKRPCDAVQAADTSVNTAPSNDPHVAEQPKYVIQKRKRLSEQTLNSLRKIVVVPEHHGLNTQHADDD